MMTMYQKIPEGRGNAIIPHRKAEIVSYVRNDIHVQTMSQLIN